MLYFKMQLKAQRNIYVTYFRCLFYFSKTLSSNLSTENKFRYIHRGQTSPRPYLYGFSTY